MNTWVTSSRYQSAYSERQVIGEIKSKIYKAAKHVGIVSQQQDIIRRDIAMSRFELETIKNEILELLDKYQLIACSHYQETVTNITKESLVLLENIPNSRYTYSLFISAISKITRKLFLIQGKLLQILKDLKAQRS